MNEMFEMALAMMLTGMMVAPVKESDLEVEAPVVRNGRRKMTRGERRERTLAKAKSRARKDREARERGWSLIGSAQLGRYYKAKAEVEGKYHERKVSWENDLPFHTDIKRNRIAKQRANSGLKDYYDSTGVDLIEADDITLDEVVKYDVCSFNKETYGIETLEEVDSYAAADKAACAIVDELVRRKEEETEIREELVYLRARIKRLEARLDEVKTDGDPVVFVVGFDSHSDVTFYDVYLD